MTAQRSSETRNYWGGMLLVAASYIFFVLSIYALVVSKLLPDTGNPILDAIKYDWYYCMLVPSLVPTTTIFIYVNWVSMKFFRHA